MHPVQSIVNSAPREKNTRFSDERICIHATKRARPTDYQLCSEGTKCKYEHKHGGGERRKTK